MKRKIQIFVMFFLALALMTFGSGCSKKQIKQEAAPVVSQKDDSAARLAAEEEEARKRAAAEEEARNRAAAEEAARNRAAAEAAQKLIQDQINAFESEKIYFDYDRADLKPEARATLEQKARFLQANSSYSVTIEGNCDERGTNEYNLALGERRADAAEKYLNSMGISSDRITTISYGEEKPVATGYNESAWSQNRRDEFKLSN